MLPLSDVKISLSTLLEAGLVAAFIGGVWFFGSSKGAASVSADGSTSSSKKTKSKKKKVGAATSPNSEVTVVEQKVDSDTRLAAKASPVQTAPAPTPAPKKKPAKTSKTAAAAPAPAPAPTPAPSQPPAQSTTLDAPSFASIATLPSTLTPQQQLKKKEKKTLAEKHLKPEPKTATSDMRDEEINPTPSAARVLKVVGGKVGAQEPVLQPWGDDEWEQEEEDGGWETAKVKKPSRASAATVGSSAFSLSNPAPQSRSIPGLSASAQTALSSQAKKNEKQKAKAAAVKEEAEKERLERLALHRRDLERARMAEQDKQRNKGRPSGIRSVNAPTKPASKVSSSAMAATLDSDSRLIWE